MGVVLIGYRGSGKTTIGRMLADSRGDAFIDTDEMIAHFAGCSIADIFAGEGEGGFREREGKAIAMATAGSGRVISVGGGAIESAENRRVLRDYGTVVWLSAPAEVLWKRISSDKGTAETRPDLAQGGFEEVVEILQRRSELYAKTAHVAVDVSKSSPRQVVKDIELLLSVMG